MRWLAEIYAHLRARLLGPDPWAPRAWRRVDDSAGCTWEPWSDGWAVGFKATYRGEVRYVVLNPSSHPETPNVFLYEGSGDNPMEQPVIYLEPFAPRKEEANDPQEH
jgi:hypothetical protein